MAGRPSPGAATVRARLESGAPLCDTFHVLHARTRARVRVTELLHARRDGELPLSLALAQGCSVRERRAPRACGQTLRARLVTERSVSGGLFFELVASCKRQLYRRAATSSRVRAPNCPSLHGLSRHDPAAFTF